MNPVLCCQDLFRNKAQIFLAAEFWPLRTHNRPLDIASSVTIPFLSGQYSSLDVGTAAGPPQVLSSTWGPMKPLQHTSASPFASPYIHHFSDVDPELGSQ